MVQDDSPAQKPNLPLKAQCKILGVTTFMCSASHNLRKSHDSQKSYKILGLSQ